MTPLEEVMAGLDRDRITDYPQPPDVTIVLTEDLPAGSELLVRHQPWGVVEVDHRYAQVESWVPARYRGLLFSVRRRARLRVITPAQIPAPVGAEAAQAAPPVVLASPAGTTGAPSSSGEVDGNFPRFHPKDPRGADDSLGAPASPLDFRAVGEDA